MARKLGDGPHAVTANRLLDGAVVFLDADRAWVERAEAAAAFEGEALDAALGHAQQQEHDNVVVAPYAIALGADGPARLRERIRAVGPTVRLDLARETAITLAPAGSESQA